MGSETVVLLVSSLDQDLGLLQPVEDLAVQEFTPQLAAEGFAIAVLLGASRCDVNGLRAKFMTSVSPQVKSRSCDPVASAGLSDVPDILRVLDDSLLSPSFSLRVGHSDLRGRLVS